jgi:hypothetical protein
MFRSRVLACFVFFFAIPAAFAVQESQSASGQVPTPDEVVRRLDQKLSLSDAQKAQIKPIIADRQQKLQALRADTSTPRKAKGRQLRSIFSESDGKINAVLNDEQKQKYAQMEQEMKAEMKHKRQQRRAAAQ